MKIESLITNELICLDLKATNKKDVLFEMASILEKKQCISNKNDYLSDVWKREDISSTGFEDGIAIPHAKSAAVIKPAVAVGISRAGIEYGADDGELSNIFFMIASPDGGDNHHIEVLAQISSKLIEDGFTDKLRAAKTADEAVTLLTQITPQKKARPTMQPTQPEVPASSFKASLSRMKQHLLFGTSHMIPFIVAGGVLLSLPQWFR
jgi:fructose-specific PTS system IIC-like component